MELNKFSLNIYSFGLSAGFICNDRIKNSPDSKMDLDRLCSFVKEKSLGGIEFPIAHFFFNKHLIYSILAILLMIGISTIEIKLLRRLSLLGLIFFTIMFWAFKQT